MRPTRLSVKMGMAWLRKGESEKDTCHTSRFESEGDKDMRQQSRISRSTKRGVMRGSGLHVDTINEIPCPTDDPPQWVRRGSWMSDDDSEVALPETSPLTMFVKSFAFDYLSSFLVVLNAVALGFQTDWEARHVGELTPPLYRTLEYVFCVIFTVELLVRLSIHGRIFFTVDLQWNLFDIFLVSTQLIEVGITLFLQSTSAGNFTVLRMLRIMRLIRIMRLMRVLRLVEELRTLVMSIAGSLRALVWAIMLLLVMMYVVGVYLTQLVADHRETNPDNSKQMDELVTYWGTLGDAVFSLYQAVTGGADWGDLVGPLRTEVHGLLAPLFMMYISFALLCMLNVITGVFVESALLTAKTDKDLYMVNHVRNLFKKVDIDNSGCISWSEFEKALANPEMLEIFKQVDMDVSEAESLFRLLDVDDTGTIDVDEFITGCSRLRGPAKSLDLSLLGREVERIGDQSAQVSRLLEAHVHWLSEHLPAMLTDITSGSQSVPEVLDDDDDDDNEV